MILRTRTAFPIDLVLPSRIARQGIPRRGKATGLGFIVPVIGHAKINAILTGIPVIIGRGVENGGIARVGATAGLCRRGRCQERDKDEPEQQTWRRKLASRPNLSAAKQQGYKGHGRRM